MKISKEGLELIKRLEGFRNHFNLINYKTKIMRYLEKFIPDYDKLKHFFIGTLAFIGLDFFFETLTSLVILFLFLWAWELIQKERGGTNT